MFSRRICRLALSLSALLCTSVFAQNKPLFTSPLPTGVRLDPIGEAVDLGSLPINLVLTPEEDRAVIVLSGWREQGVQVVDLKNRKVTQTLLQDGAFYGAAFSPDGHRLCVSGGNTDMIFVYAWKDGAATLENKFELAKAKTADGTGTSYPAGLAFSPNGKFLYVAEDVGDRLAVVNAATGEITQRFSTDHYPYGVALTADGQVLVSAWGGSTVSQFRVLADGTLANALLHFHARRTPRRRSSGTQMGRYRS
jgi:DNA-binding beta-propeller fold protein YncE